MKMTAILHPTASLRTIVLNEREFDTESRGPWLHGEVCWCERNDFTAYVRSAGTPSISIEVSDLTAAILVL